MDIKLALTLSYLAGVIDSDGSIGIKKSTYAVRKRKDQISPSYWPRIQVSQVTTEAIDLCVEIFGGTIRRVKPTAKRGKWLYKWDVQHKRAVTTIQTLLPYLRIKNRQARLALDLAELKAKGPLGRHDKEHLNRWGKISKFRQRCFTVEQLDAFEGLYREMRLLNDTREDRQTTPIR